MVISHGTKFKKQTKSPFNKLEAYLVVTLRIHVGYIYLRLVDFKGKIW